MPIKKLFTFVRLFSPVWISYPLPLVDRQQQEQQSELARILLRLADPYTTAPTICGVNAGQHSELNTWNIEFK
jgi:hypothetical protein